MPKFSIIIPLYNAEPYISQCLNSIIHQTYHDFEVIIIDDGSTDNSAQICKDIAGHDSRFSYFYKTNGGVSSARNAGIKRAKGEWLSFVDADDELYNQALSIMAEIIDKGNVDLVIGGYVDSSKHKRDIYQKKHSYISLDKIATMNLMFLTKKYGYQGYIWNKAFKRSIIHEHNISFNTSIKYNEDRLFCIEYLNRINASVYLTTIPIYHYLQRETGVMATAYKFFDADIYTDFSSSVLIIELLSKHKYPKRTINLAYDRLIDSYDLIRHNMKHTNYTHARIETRILKQRTIKHVGHFFFWSNRIRRFLNKHLSKLLKDVYIESLPI